jgi:hypothetical protein
MREITTIQTEREDKLADAKRQGQAQFESIKEMVEALRATDRTDLEGSREWDRKREEAQRAIEEDALSVQVRSGWYAPGAASEAPAEYEILLCTGGPACRIVGELSEHCEPQTARLEVQDWFQPWTAIRPLVRKSVAPIADDYDSEQILLAYAQCFWFGE